LWFSWILPNEIKISFILATLNLPFANSFPQIVFYLHKILEKWFSWWLEWWQNLPRLCEFSINTEIYKYMVGQMIGLTVTLRNSILHFYCLNLKWNIVKINKDFCLWSLILFLLHLIVIIQHCFLLLQARWSTRLYLRKLKRQLIR